MSMNIKNILNKGKEAIKSGVDKGVKNSKELYELSKKRAKSEIHKQTKKVALDVIDKTIRKAKSPKEKMHLKASEEIVEKVYEKGGEIGEIKVGDFIKKKGSNIELEVKEVGNDWRSKKDYIKIYNDVTNSTKTLIDWSDYEKVKYAKGGFIGKGELVWNKLSNSAKADFLRENFTPLITPRTQESLVGKAYNFLPKSVKIKFEAKYADVEEYEDGGSVYEYKKAGSTKNSFGWAKEYLDDNEVYDNISKYIMYGNGKEVKKDNVDYIYFDDGSALVFDEKKDRWINYETSKSDKQSEYISSIQPYDEEKYPSKKAYLKELVTKIFGKQNTYSSSADWGGMPVWTVNGDKYEGTFIIIDDNDKLILMTRDKRDEEDIDEELMSAEYDNVNDITDLLNKARYMSVKEYEDGGSISKYKIFEGHDHLKNKPLYKVISTNEDNDYVGEWHTNRNDAEEELKGLSENKDIKAGQIYDWIDRGAENTIFVTDVSKNEVKYKLNGVNKSKSLKEFKEMLSEKGIKAGYKMQKGGMVVTSIKDIPNFKERIEEGKITYRGLGLGKLWNDFYKLAGEGGTRIKVDGKEYYITDSEFDTFSRDENGKMKIRFDAPARKGYEHGGTLQKDEFDWNELFEPLSPKEQEELLLKLKKEEKDTITNEKNIHAKNIRAKGSNWNEAFIFRVKSARHSISKFIEWAKKKDYNKANDWFNDALENVESIKELGYEARRYGNSMKKRLRNYYDELYIKNNKNPKYKNGGTINQTNTKTMTQENIDKLVGIAKSTNKVASEIATKKLREAGLDKDGKQIKEEQFKKKTGKPYHHFKDKFGKEYEFDNYADFAKFWFSLSRKYAMNNFPNFKLLQKYASDSKEARTKIDLTTKAPTSTPKTEPKKTDTLKKADSSSEPDCDDLYKQYKKRQIAQKKAKQAPQKRETTKNKEKIEKVEDSLDLRFKAGKLTKNELQKMYNETKALLEKIKKYLDKL